MESKVTSLLTVLSIAITTVVAMYLFTGPGYAIELSAVSLLALAGWLQPLTGTDHMLAMIAVEPGAHNSVSALYSTYRRRLLPRCCSVA